MKLRAVPFTDVQIRDSFWAPRQETNRVASIPINFANLEKAGNIHNFELAAAKQPNGYLDTHFIVKEPAGRWTNLRDCHELYCAGHLFEAAVAHFQATGKRSFLNVAMKLADPIDSVFGPGKRMGYPGHPEIELALVKLWRVTGEPRYFALARFFIESRGRKFFAEEQRTPLDDHRGSVLCLG